MPSSDADTGKSRAARKGMDDGPPTLKPPTQLKFSFYPEENDHQDIRAYLMQFLAADAEDWDDSPADDNDKALPGINVPKSPHGKKSAKGGRGKKGKKGKAPAPADNDSAKFMCPMCGSPFTENDTSCPNCGKFFD